MKYLLKAKSEQIIQLDGKTAVRIKPAGGDMPDAQAKAAAKTAWGKRLIETGCLVFESKPETSAAPKRKVKPQKPSEVIPDFDGGGDAA